MTIPLARGKGSPARMFEIIPKEPYVWFLYLRNELGGQDQIGHPDGYPTVDSAITARTRIIQGIDSPQDNPHSRARKPRKTPI